MSKKCQVHQLQIPCKPLGQGYFYQKVVPIIPESCILEVMSKKSGGEVILKNVHIIIEIFTAAN